MNIIFYNAFLSLYIVAVKILSVWNSKARLWIAGQKNVSAVDFNTECNKIIWMHCASLGEFEQGRPVIESIKKQYPAVKIILTFFSPSGYEIQKNYSGADAILYLPFDSKAHAKNFIKAVNPALVLWVKYDYWFYYLKQLKLQNIPVLLVSGIFRNSQPFFKWYGKFWKEMLSFFSYFFVQNISSKQLLNSISINEIVTVTGDTRFDRVIEIAEHFVDLPLIKKYCGDNKVIVAGSTWEDDEAELIHYVRANPAIKFIIAPHKIDRENLRDVKNQFAGSVFYSELINNEQTTANVLIIDNVGMLSKLYYYADITYVGGGFGNDGVHNILEAAVYGKPVIYGPEYEKYIEAIELIACGGGITINSALELEKALINLWSSKEFLKDTGQAAKNYVYSNGGATEKIMKIIQEKRLLIS